MKPALPLEINPSPLNETRIGPYRLLEQIGEGGMGRVYLAERADGEYEQRVALKLVHLDEDETQLLPRFYQERQALAQLAHPNIARLLDGGVTESGQPYLVMEYIDGLPLDEYCERNHCDILTRVRLFRDVLAGVQHAHQHLFVHRDLKPSNILVTREGVPKLLDFGIAKWLQTTQVTPKLTRTGQQPMTPEYASPEQVRNEAVSTVSDVYALGVLLYELLTGHSPYRSAASDAYDLQKAIREEEPEPPSAVVAHVVHYAASEHTPAKVLTPEAVSATRESSPRMLRRRLAGDLDSIVLKALRKEPQKRYGSAEQFSEDLSRYVEGQPVRAREGKLSYRAGKFVRLHKFGVSAVSLLVLLSLSFGFTMKRETQRTERERDKAQEVSKFLADIFTLTDPNVARADTVTADALLKMGAARIDSLAGQPEVQAELKDLMGNIYRKLGQYDVAEPLLRSALAFRVREYGEAHRAVADTKSNLGSLLHEEAHYEQAETLLREAMMIYRKVSGYESYDNGFSTGNLALTLLHKGEVAQAETFFNEAVAILRKIFPNGHQDLAAGLNNIGLIKMRAKAFREAENFFLEAYTMLEKTLPAGNPTFAFALTSIGNARMAQEDYVSADSLFRAALAVSRQAFPQGHWLTARIHCRIAMCSIRLQRHLVAEANLNEAYHFQKKVQGHEHPYTQETIKVFVALYEAWPQPQQAEAYRKLLSESLASN